MNHNGLINELLCIRSTQVRALSTTASVIPRHSSVRRWSVETFEVAALASKKLKTKIMEGFES